jgi:hypothetical protein
MNKLAHKRIQELGPNLILQLIPCEIFGDEYY